MCAVSIRNIPYPRKYRTILYGNVGPRARAHKGECGFLHKYYADAAIPAPFAQNQKPIVTYAPSMVSSRNTSPR
jgi:hypothetical protein